MNLHFRYSDQLIETLSPSLIGEVIMDELEAYGQNIGIGSGFKMLNINDNLTQQIPHDFKLVYRPEGEPYNANLTFETKSASCRDLAWMQIQLIRSIGLASKFVSGYFFVVSGSLKYELHAWLEVYLPGGAGWIGFDPINLVIVEKTTFLFVPGFTIKMLCPLLVPSEVKPKEYLLCLLT